MVPRQEPKNREEISLASTGRFLTRNRRWARAMRRSGDFGEERIDGAEDRLLVTTGDLMQALEAANAL